MAEPIIPGLGTLKAVATKGAAVAGGPGGTLFAMLLSRLGAVAGGEDAALLPREGGRLEKLTLPGDAASKGGLLEELSKGLDALAEGVEDSGDLVTLAEQLGLFLQTFDAKHGTDTQSVLARNAAALPGLTVPAEGADAAGEFVAIVRGLLGLDAGREGAKVVTASPATVEPQAAAPKVAAPAPEASFMALIERATQRDVAPQPEGRVVAALQDLAAPRAAEAQPASAPAAPQAQHHQNGGFAANLAGQIKGTRLDEGTTRIELAPRGLGAMEIDLARDDNGALKVTIRAENPGVLHALRENRETLLAVLRDSGAQVQDAALGFENFGRGNPGQQEAQQSAPAQAGDEEEIAAEQEQTMTALPEGRIDIVT